MSSGHHVISSAEHPADTPSRPQLAPLPGEAGIPDVSTPTGRAVSAKSLLAIALPVVTLAVIAALSIHRVAAGARYTEQTQAGRDHERPAAALAAPRKLDLGRSSTPLASPATASAPTAAPSVASQGYRVPAIEGRDEDEPIPLRTGGAATPRAAGSQAVPAEDAPILLVSSRQTPVSADRAAPTEPSDAGDPLAATTRNLQAYQRQLQGLLDNLSRSAALAGGQTAGGGPASAFAPTGLVGNTPPSGSPPGSGLFGGQLQASATPRVAATRLGNRSLTLPKGTAFSCALKTRVVSATSGFVGCLVQRNVYGDDGRVLLIERGSHLDGEYRSTAVRPGTVRIPILWTRLRTPLGVTVDLDSPGTGQLGESGVDGVVDNRWGERIGAALLLSLIDDAVKVVAQEQTQRSDSGSSTTVVLPSTTANASKLAEKVLDSSIQIPPVIVREAGGIVGIYVARDVDFSGVYALQPSARESTAALKRATP